MRIVFTGVVYGGETARRETVTVTVTGSGLRLERPDGAEWWSYSDMRQTQGRLRGEPIRFERTDMAPPASLVIEDEDVVRSIRAVAPETAGAFGTARPILRIALAAGGGALALGALLYVWVIPALAVSLSAKIPVHWEEQLGDRVAASLAPVAERCDDPTVREALEGIVARLQAARPDSPYRYRVAVSRGRAVNAFAAPGGFLVVNAGLLSHAARPEEVAGVMAHELAHVELRHGTQRILRAVPVQLLLGAVTGDATGLGAMLNAAGNLGSLRYQRRDESAADVEGLAMLRAARIDPAGLVDFFRTLDTAAPDPGGPLAYLSTHPETTDRIARLESLIADAPPVAPEPVAVPGPWEDVATRCSGADRGKP